MSDERDGLDVMREFHQRRQRVIGATDAPKILLLSRWGTPLSVYRDKVTTEEPKPPSLPAWLGLKLQSTVGELYTTATGTRLRAVNVQFHHPEHPFIGCHLDFRAWGNAKLLIEAKTRASTRGWGPDGSSEVPVEEWVQGQHEMAVTGATECHFAVLFGHRDFRVLRVLRDEAFIAGMIPKLVAFWNDHVLPRIPPVADALDHDTVHELYPEPVKEMRAATPEQAAMVRELVAARKVAAEAKAAEERSVNRIKQAIGDAAGISGSFGEITWTKNKDSARTDWEMVAATFKADNPDAWADAYGRHTTNKPGARTIRYALNEEDDDASE